MTVNTALVVGATGAVAVRLVELLGSLPDWSVVGICRNRPPDRPRLRYLALDLLDAAECRARLSAERGVTHVFHCARAAHGEGGRENVADNVAMLRNVLDAIEAGARDLRHVHLVEGGKYYGLHLGPYPTPAREDDPRHAPPNFYYDQEDLLVERHRRGGWSWSASRPNVVCDFAPQRARNLTSILGAYAAICRELGQRLDFPGRPAAFAALTEVTAATHLARAMLWMATEPDCANQAFNVTNGDLIRWRRFWPRLATYFGLEPGAPRGLVLADWMKDKEAVWQRVVARHGLRPSRLNQVALFAFGDFVFGQDYDVISSTTRLRRSGFCEVVDSEAMFFDQLGQYRQARVLP
jgi:nucleoside-diphosphate-sugar epimerase